MGKTVGRIAALAGFAALTFIPGIGQALQGTIISSLGGTFLAATLAPAIVAIASVGLTIGAVEPKMIKLGSSGLRIGGFRPRQCMAPIRSKQHAKRFGYGLASGDCLGSAMEEGEFMVVDRAAAIRIGDLAMFQLNDGGPQAVKRFAGLADDGTFEVQTLNPVVGLHIDAADVAWCYRVVAHKRCPGLLGRLSLAYRVRRHPDQFIAKLGDLSTEPAPDLRSVAPVEGLLAAAASNQ